MDVKKPFTIVITRHEEMEYTFDSEEEYRNIKESGDLDLFLDVYVSDMDGRTTITEPDGTEYYLYGY
jgi:hypothetical protein